MVNQQTFPGWGCMIERGATSIWEHWAYSDNTYSHNHPMFGSVSEWLYKYVAGIRPDSAAVGFNKIIIKPEGFYELPSLKASYASINGSINIEWEKGKEHTQIKVTVPVNTTAKIYLPLKIKGQWSCNQPSVLKKELPSSTEDWQCIETGSGSYIFVIR